jgi:hypothetical protein
LGTNQRPKVGPKQHPSVTKFTVIILFNLLKPKGAAKLKLLPNELTINLPQRPVCAADHCDQNPSNY